MFYVPTVQFRTILSVQLVKILLLLVITLVSQHFSKTDLSDFSIGKRPNFHCEVAKDFTVISKSTFNIVLNLNEIFFNFYSLQIVIFERRKAANIGKKWKTFQNVSWLHQDKIICKKFLKKNVCLIYKFFL